MRARVGRGAIACALVIGLALTGCSFILVDAPPSSRPAQIYPYCTENRAAPIVDALFAALYVYQLAVGGTEYELTNGDATRKQAVVSGTIGTVLFGSSAFYGFRTTQRCRTERMAFAALPVPQPLPPPAPVVPVPIGEGGACRAATDCQTGLSCASSICVHLPPPAPAPVPTSEPVPETP